MLRAMGGRAAFQLSWRRAGSSARTHLTPCLRPADRRPRTQESTPDRIAQAAALVKEGRPEDVAFRLMDVDGAAMTARRWLSLACPGGDDDMFSAGLSAGQLAAIYAPLEGLPSLLLLSGAEEYLAGSQGEYEAAARRLAQARCRARGARGWGGWGA